MAGQGRYPTITPKIAEFICTHISNGMSVRKVCELGIKEIEGFPKDRGTIFHWLILAEETNAPLNLKDFSHQYHKAQESKAEALADEITDIADDDSLDIGFKEDKEGNAVPFIDREHIMRSKLRCDTRMWVSSRLLPKKYGVKTEQATRFVDKDGNDVNVNVTIGDKSTNSGKK